MYFVAVGGEDDDELEPMLPLSGVGLPSPEGPLTPRDASKPAGPDDFDSRFQELWRAVTTARSYLVQPLRQQIAEQFMCVVSVFGAIARMCMSMVYTYWSMVHIYWITLVAYGTPLVFVPKAMVPFEKRGPLLAPRGRAQAPGVKRAEERLVDLSASQLARMLRAGELTSVALVRAYIARIQDVNSAINAIVAERFADALLEASAADARLADARRENTVQSLCESSPLLGVPFSTKESFEVAGMPHTAGLVARQHVSTII